MPQQVTLDLTQVLMLLSVVGGAYAFLWGRMAAARAECHMEIERLRIEFANQVRDVRQEQSAFATRMHERIDEIRADMVSPGVIEAMQEDIRQIRDCIQMVAAKVVNAAE